MHPEQEIRFWAELLAVNPARPLPNRFDIRTKRRVQMLAEELRREREGAGLAAEPRPAGEQRR